MNADGSIPAEPKGALNGFYGGREEKRKAAKNKRSEKKRRSKTTRVMALDKLLHC
jgi:hypothetical protein